MNNFDYSLLFVQPILLIGMNAYHAIGCRFTGASNHNPLRRLNDANKLRAIFDKASFDRLLVTTSQLMINECTRNATAASFYCERVCSTFVV